jgi:hypothetical protein
MDVNLLTTAANLGLGAFIALITIYWKRQDDAKHAEALKEMSDRLAHLNDEMREVVKSNTQAMIELREAIKGLRRD